MMQVMLHPPGGFRHVQGSRSEPESRQQFVFADRESREFAMPALQTQGSGTNEVLRKFDRDTRWVAAGLLSVLLLAALVFVGLFPERHTGERRVAFNTEERKMRRDSGSNWHQHFRINDAQQLNPFKELELCVVRRLLSRV
jgi:hypothetical protein